MNSLLRLAFSLSLLALAAGCSGKRTNVTGTITQGGKPFVSESDEGELLVLFIPEGANEKSKIFRAEVDRKAGTFVLPEIAAGRYLVAIQQFDAKYKDALNHQYDPAKSPLRFDVQEDGQVIQIDLPG